MKRAEMDIGKWSEVFVMEELVFTVIGICV